MTRPNTKITIFLAVLILSGVTTIAYVKTSASGPGFVPQVQSMPSIPAGAARSPRPHATASKSARGRKQHPVIINKIWIIGVNAIQQMENNGASSALIKQAFDNNHTYIYGDTPHSRYPPSMVGVPTLTYSSYAGIQKAFANGTLPGGYKAVLYDNEHWAATPLAEQQHFARYEELVAQLLHKHGLLYIATPSPDLTEVLYKRVISTDGAFLRARIPAITARYADILDLQAQFHETDVAGYRSFVQAAAAQARAANPRVTIVVGIRTNPGGLSMLTAYQATASIGEGYWLNINDIPSPAVYLLDHLYRMH